MNYQDICAKLDVDKLEGFDFDCYDLRYADLRGANLRDCDLRDCDLRDADLSGADLTGALLREADLRRTNFSNTCVTVFGEDSRGYVFYTMPGIFIGAGCRWFETEAAALDHWNERHKYDKYTREECLAYVKQAKEFEESHAKEN